MSNFGIPEAEQARHAADRSEALQDEMYKLLHSASGTGEDPIPVPLELISRLYAHLGNASLVHLQSVSRFYLDSSKIMDLERQLRNK